MSISIQEQDFDLAAEMTALRASNAGTGALVSFVGLVRDFSEEGRVENIFLEHYHGMTEKALREIIDEAATRWNLLGSRVIHRIGPLQPNDQIVLVATAATHRREAFAACEFIIDYLKTAAPFWKREQTAQGGKWLETHDADIRRTEHWLKEEEKS